MHRALFEACVETLDGAIAATHVADRLELCSDLNVGGCTPSTELLRACAACVDRPIVAMIRPRGGNFVYDNTELRAMRAAMATLRAAGARGFATGALTPAGDIDVGAMKRLVAAADGLPVTFHRAFDTLRAPQVALAGLRDLGVTRILTSGGAPTALAGSYRLAELVELSRGAVEIIAAGAVRPPNVAQLIDRTKVPAFHARWTGWMGEI